MKSDLVKLQRILGYTFQDQHLLLESMMHRSFATENNLKFNNQRLEFLGDSVLQIILTEYIFRKYPDYAEGPLTKIRSGMADQTSFALLARKLNLGEFLMLGRGENEAGRDRDSTLSDAFEAVMAAIFLDSNLEVTRGIVLKLIEDVYPEPTDILSSNNPKGRLQEFCQHNFGMSPVYETLSVEGPEHDPVFTVQVSLGESILATYSAKKRKYAEGIAATEGLSLLKAGKVPPYIPKKQ